MIEHLSGIILVHQFVPMFEPIMYMNQNMEKNETMAVQPLLMDATQYAEQNLDGTVQLQLQVHAQFAQASEEIQEGYHLRYVMMAIRTMQEDASQTEQVYLMAGTDLVVIKIKQPHAINSVVMVTLQLANNAKMVVRSTLMDVVLLVKLRLDGHVQIMVL